MSDKNTVLNQINLAKENNQNAFSFLLNFYWDDVYKFQLKRTNNEINAEDITIESFAKAFEKINTYNQKFVFKTWLITISKNLHIDQLRKNKNNFDLNQLNENIQIKESSPSPEDNLINEQKLKSLKSKINKLKPHYKEVIELKCFNELSYKEISIKLNQPINNIKVKVLRAKKILFQLISEND
ncbi:sigma-70 family RNA polymerase sigma factor [Flavobacteriaceae bacterium]|nr:sigma-70 family RNA polymerase sigma factor [Flavobacteriaceae bacterium]MBT4231901.1 sigma-70 family RNA polymerase sigma factor [Flavobacteriaceae bacterium]MBT5393106.1 sigma-70 family RNA polymerase sigma factor [Flavobacteriaceae bacterium]MBT7575377.1 sigma-70 family RNA polymerase sigma factor [Flavobacteriaceae bacterium]MBT7984307.1 sigma-70 family RNA polymerase sigma factor [Flavobacteriaceae bacterium]